MRTAVCGSAQRARYTLAAGVQRPKDFLEEVGWFLWPRREDDSPVYTDTLLMEAAVLSEDQRGMAARGGTQAELGSACSSASSCSTQQVTELEKGKLLLG